MLALFNIGISITWSRLQCQRILFSKSCCAQSSYYRRQTSPRDDAHRVRCLRTKLASVLSHGLTCAFTITLRMCDSIKFFSLLVTWDAPAHACLGLFRIYHKSHKQCSNRPDYAPHVQVNVSFQILITRQVYHWHDSSETLRRAWVLSPYEQLPPNHSYLAKYRL